MTTGWTLLTLDGDAVRGRLAELVDVLVDCVDGGASVSFLAPLDRDVAEAWWSRTADRVAADAVTVLVAELEGQVVGTVLLDRELPPNQPHRADVAKLLVHRRARRRGIASALMRAVEAEAVRRGCTLLVLDTQTGSGAEALYERAGWHRVGEIPGFALTPDGHLAATTIFFRTLPAAPGQSLGMPDRASSLA